MLSATAIRRWSFVHTWSSLICMVFLLLLGLTGLPLIFADEIADWTNDDPPYVELPAGTPPADLDPMVETARRRHPGEIPRFVFVDDDEPRVVVAMAPSWDADPSTVRRLTFDARTAELIRDRPPADEEPWQVMAVVRRLHTDLFTDLPGELFLGAMGLLFMASIASGAVLYAPFMRKLAFGTMRTDRSRRLRWLDLHNLIGIVTLAWTAVVGVTGVVNELSTPLFGLWRMTEVGAMLAPYRDRPVPERFGSVQAAYGTVRAALPGKTVISVVFPNNRLGSPYHFLVWTKGDSPLTSRLFTPALVDARSGELTAVAELPWYLKALEVSRPLHFGDYGGTPLKIIWALFDVAMIVTLGSGLSLWAVRRKVPVEARLAPADAAVER